MTAPKSNAGKKTTSSPPSTILIVDDEVINRRYLTELFKGDNYRIIEASNGLDAIRLTIDERPDIILLDIIMPGLDGYSICTSLKENPQTSAIPIILVTALTSNKDETKGFEVGAVDYIHKPVNPVVVRARVKAHLKVKYNQDTLDNANAKLQLLNKLLEQEIQDRLLAEQELTVARDEVTAANQVKEGVIKDLFQAMCEMLSSRDLYTFEHGMRVASISRLIGEEMNMSPSELDALELGCMLHDISKVAIPDDVLLKPGVFDAQDREIMRLHPQMGARIFMRQSCDPRIIDVIHHHHERLDGSGYPEGLEGSEISLPVRIAMVADIYEAMVATRPYKKSLNRKTALELIQKEAEQGLLDPEIVTLLKKVTEDWNPFEHVHQVSDEGTRSLEMFREKTYFKEPLSDFYNYRYLLFLEKSGLLDNSNNGYSLFKINVKNLAQLNKEHGYVKSDQLLDITGTKLHDFLLSMIHKTGHKCTAILTRKGSTYIIYINCKDKYLTLLNKQIEKSKNDLASDEGLEIGSTQKKFSSDVSMEEALSQLLSE